MLRVDDVTNGGNITVEKLRAARDEFARWFEPGSDERRFVVDRLFADYWWGKIQAEVDKASAAPKDGELRPRGAGMRKF